MLRRLLKMVALATLVGVGGTVLARAFGYELGPNTIVRCRQGHLTTTSWIPGVKLKGLDLGVARIQRCPGGERAGHWSLVTPMRPATLSEDDRREALAHHDVRIP